MNDRAGLPRRVMLGWLLAGCIAPRIGDAQTPGRVIFAGSPAEKKIALTFDACATRAPSKVDRRVIDALATTKTRATFFLGGKWMTDHPAETRALASHAGFELANHSYLHLHMTRLSGPQIARELRKTQDILHALTGQTARWFRPPYGEWSQAVADTAAALGLTTIMYDLPSGDPDTSATAEKLLDYVGHRARNGSIVVMHVNGRGWHTAEALPGIITRLRARGYELVTVGELVERLPSAGHTAADTTHKTQTIH